MWRRSEAWVSAVGRRAMPDGGAARNVLYRNYRSRASVEGLAFTLTPHQFHELTVQSCHYCGCEPAQRINSKYRGGPFTYNGIDRMDNAVGYVLRNCAPCCKRCNTMKGNFSYQEFVVHLKRMYDHWLAPFIGIVADVEIYAEDTVAGRR